MWLTAVALSATGSAVSEDIGETEFNDIFLQCPVVKYIRNGAVHSIYHRTTAIPSGFNAYSLFTHTWSDTNNVLGTDFEIYDSYGDLLGGTNKWTYCNYDDSDVGYPRDCGKDGSVGSTWFSMPDGEHSARGLTSGASFELWTGGGCGTQELYTDEDGWSLLLAYNHVGGEKEDLVPGTAPQSPTGYSHIWLDDIGLTADDVEAVRFYCTSALHSRVAHWSTDALIAKQSIINGILGPFTGYTSWSTGTTKLSNHTADLPDAINDGWGSGIKNALESCVAPSRGTCTDLFHFPFYRWSVPTLHRVWGINVASSGNGFSCDEEVYASYAHSTLHQIWFKRKV